ncbi:hypothetical protein CKO15_11140 [Halorhodospira abdelmalekii]|uniref:type VI secretion protein IcmF/TssM N-terminal domain-containing protein n=1 Tax=Halorhodospira abdelmalekii TaxID=421629 RepID=UPI001902F1D9|nr:type VI secretion protein IcmF/TssM N-terminal domain-containing protein [Halorhodospira abdelmalekii]MBK1735821.1 hypothetical protein [Halorhodospira abdelmalekii]
MERLMLPMRLLGGLLRSFARVLLILLLHPYALLAWMALGSAALAWWGLPWLGVTALVPRLLAVAALLTIALLLGLVMALVRRRRRSRQVQALQPLTGAGGEEAERLERLHNAFADGVERLQRACGVRPGSRYGLERLPLYLLLGAPGVGKSALLRASGLSFPYDTPLEVAQRGLGGTACCDWWLSERAAFLDTSGGYLDQEQRHSEWQALLSELYRLRPQRPLNGVVVTCSACWLQTASGDERARQARQLRERLAELRATLRQRVPIFIVITQLDALPGFVPFFSALSAAQRQQPWGVALTGKRGAAAAAAIADLSSGLGERRLQCAGEQTLLPDRIAAFAFPEQLQQLSRPLGDWLQRLTGDDPYRQAPQLEGLYLTGAPGAAGDAQAAVLTAEQIAAQSAAAAQTAAQPAAQQTPQPASQFDPQLAPQFAPKSAGVAPFDPHSPSTPSASFGPFAAHDPSVPSAPFDAFASPASFGGSVPGQPFGASGLSAEPWGASVSGQLFSGAGPSAEPWGQRPATPPGLGYFIEQLLLQQILPHGERRAPLDGRALLHGGVKSGSAGALAVGVTLTVSLLAESAAREVALAEEAGAQLSAAHAVLSDAQSLDAQRIAALVGLHEHGQVLAQRPVRPLWERAVAVDTAPLQQAMLAPVMRQIVEQTVLEEATLALHEALRDYAQAWPHASSSERERLRHPYYQALAVYRMLTTDPQRLDAVRASNELARYWQLRQAAAVQQEQGGPQHAAQFPLQRIQHHDPRLAVALTRAEAVAAGRNGVSPTAILPTPEIEAVAHSLALVLQQQSEQEQLQQPNPSSQVHQAGRADQAQQAQSSNGSLQARQEAPAAASRALIEQAANQLAAPLSAAVLYERLYGEIAAQLPAIGIADLVSGRDRTLWQSSATVAGVYGGEAWERHFEPRLTELLGEVGQGDWVIADATTTDQAPLAAAQIEALRRQVEALYINAFVTEWLRFIGALRPASFASLHDAAQRLDRLAGEDGAWLRLLAALNEHIAAHTVAPSSLGDIADQAAGSRALSRTTRRAAGAAGSLARMQQPDPGRYRYDARGRELAALLAVPEEGGVPALLVGYLSAQSALQQEIEQLALAVDGGEQSAAYAADLIGGRGDGRAVASGFGALERSLGGLSHELRQQWRPLLSAPLERSWHLILVSARGHLNECWQQEVVGPYRAELAGRFPLQRDGRDVAVGDFEAFFRPHDGVLWGFVDEQLAPFVQQRGGRWQERRWRGTGVGLTADTLDALEQAQRITRSLFGERAEINLDYRVQVAANVDLTDMRLDLHGTTLRYRNEPERWQPFSWSSGDLAGGRVVTVSGHDGRVGQRRVDGEWALLRLLSEAQALYRHSDAEWSVEWQLHSAALNGHSLRPLQVRIRTERSAPVLGWTDWSRWALPGRVVR